MTNLQAVIVALPIVVLVALVATNLAFHLRTRKESLPPIVTELSDFFLGETLYLSLDEYDERQIRDGKVANARISRHDDFSKLHGRLDLTIKVDRAVKEL